MFCAVPGSPIFCQLTPLILTKCRPILKFLLAEGVNIEARTSVGKTPLHLACYFNQAQCTEALLQNGADRGALDNKGQTPLDLASMMGHRQVLQLLERSGQHVAWEDITISQVPERWFQWTQNPSEYNDITEAVRAGMEKMFRCPAFSGEQADAEAAEAAAESAEALKEQSQPERSVEEVLQALREGNPVDADEFFSSSESEDSEEDREN